MIIEYYDPTNDYGVLADLQYRGIKLGLIHWKRKEGYGPYYVADRAQNNSFWNKDSDQFFFEYNKQITDSLKSHSLLLYQEGRRYGYWAEADPDGDTYSYISFTHWNSEDNSWLFKQNFELTLRKNACCKFFCDERAYKAKQSSKFVVHHRKIYSNK